MEWRGVKDLMHGLMSTGERNGRARWLFGEILARHDLHADWDRKDWAAVVAELPVQRGLAFPITLAFRSENELLLSTLGLEKLYTPWPEDRSEAAFLRAVNGLIGGRARLVRHLGRGGRPWRLVLEESREDGSWRRLALQHRLGDFPWATPWRWRAARDIQRNVAPAPLRLVWNATLH